MSSTTIEARYALAQSIARQAGLQALAWFRKRDELVIESKGLQDMVSAADKDTELYIRAQVLARFADDGFLGEEGGLAHADADYLWVIDPIDGTACFVNGMHAWCLSIAVTYQGKPVIGVVYDPNSDEMFHACAGQGAYVNQQAMRAHGASSITEGVLGVGFSHRVPVSAFVPFLDRVLSNGGMFIRNGSGALMLSYVAAGRLIGYYEPHINSWDCLAAIVLVQEAGGTVNDFLADNGLHDGNPIIAAGAQLYGPLLALIQPT
ncbi:myo-inositol-1(or 4)-monophosphatase [Rhodoferax sp. OV413]|uniref:inositol monophosphatase family protein n=1 Tax=Rhodoferax sp. OV413 TaxID=1855285 RepID=UPI00087F37E2|nr:inositol monophosphatase family protein [Rhodoferax sp. OV413]SDP89937.1 myo-inositol-1(or 4)-monophosphatase [Rhodoferax sp. OV413]